MNTFLTIISGVAVFVVGQFVLELFIKPWNKYRSIKSKIVYILAYNAHQLYYALDYNCKESDSDLIRYRRASHELRNVAAELIGFIEEKHPLFFIPRKEQIYKASSQLIALSNGVSLLTHRGSVSTMDFIACNRKSERTLRKLLRLYPHMTFEAP